MFLTLWTDCNNFWCDLDKGRVRIQCIECHIKGMTQARKRQAMGWFILACPFIQYSLGAYSVLDALIGVLVGRLTNDDLCYYGNV